MLQKILSNELTAFAFVLSCAVGAFTGIAATYWLGYQLFVALGAY